MRAEAIDRRAVLCGLLSGDKQEAVERRVRYGLRRVVEARQDVLRCSRHCLECHKKVNGLVGEWHQVSRSLLHSCGRNRPLLLLDVDLAPRGVGEFRLADECEKQEFRCDLHTTVCADVLERILYAVNFLRRKAARTWFEMCDGAWRYVLCRVLDLLAFEACPTED